MTLELGPSRATGFLRHPIFGMIAVPYALWHTNLHMPSGTEMYLLGLACIN